MPRIEATSAPTPPIAVPMFVSEVWILPSAVCIDERSSPIVLMASLICVNSDRHTLSNFSSIFCTSDKMLG